MCEQEMKLLFGLDKDGGGILFGQKTKVIR